MGVKIEAAPMVADARIVEPVVIAIENIPSLLVTLPVMAVASSSCPSMGSHSISAVAPNYYFKEELALAAA